MDNDKFAILREKQEEIRKMKQEMLEASNKIFTDLTKTIFEDHPKLESFGWSQYTPYFNDGETCTFSANKQPNFAFSVRRISFCCAL